MFIVYGKEHPAHEERIVGRYRWKWLADLHAWLYERVEPSLQWASARVAPEREEALN